MNSNTVTADELAQILCKSACDVAYSFYEQIGKRGVVLYLQDGDATDGYHYIPADDFAKYEITQSLKHDVTRMIGEYDPTSQCVFFAAIDDLTIEPAIINAQLPLPMVIANRRFYN